MSDNWRSQSRILFLILTKAVTIPRNFVVALTQGDLPRASESSSPMREDEPASPVSAPAVTPVVAETSLGDPMGPTGLPSNVCASLAVMIPIVGGIAFLILERKDRFVRFYSIQSIILGVLLGAAALILSLVKMIFGEIPFLGDAVLLVARIVYGIFALAWLAVYFVAMFKAFSHKAWAIPYFGPVVKRYAPR